MGLHSGEAQVRDGDYFGAVVNKAARVMAAGHGGQTLMSAATATLVEGHPLKNLGPHRLRDLEGETVLWQLGTDDHPPLRTLDQLPGNLPLQRTSFVGRTDDVKVIEQTVDESRLVTLVGPGGVGKSRLALQVAAEMSADFPGGTWFAGLGSLTEPDLVAETVVDALGLGERRGETATQTLVDWFATRDALLVIDNCEHLLDAVAAILDRLLEVNSDSRLLATSQASLGVRGEVVHAVEPLGRGGSTSESVQLFVERAHAVRSGFQLNDDNESAVVEICDRLDHIPLAIELAASRAKAMSPADIAGRLDVRFRLLASHDRSAPDRQRTLEGAMRWSYELLDDTERAVLRRLSVLVAPFNLGAAEAVAGDDEGLEAWEVLDALHALVDKSLVIVRDSDDTTRYNLLESVRQFGRTELEAEHDLAPRSQRYAGHFADFALDRTAQFLGPEDQQAFDDLEREWEHIRVALRATADDVESDRFERILDGLAPFFLCRDRQREAVLWAAELLDRPIRDPLLREHNLAHAAISAQHFDRSQAEGAIAEVDRLQLEFDLSPSPLTTSLRATQAMMRGDNELALELVAEVLAEVQPASATDAWHFQTLNNAYSTIAVIGGREDGAEQLRAYVSAADRTGAAWVRVGAASSFSPVIHELDPEGALDFLARHLELATQTGQRQVVVHFAMFHGIQLLRLGDFAGASTSLGIAVREAVERCPPYLGQNANTVIALTLREWPHTAAALLGGLERWRREHDNAGTTIERDSERHYDERLREVLGDDFEPHHARGWSMTETQLAETLMSTLAAIAEGTMVDEPDDVDGS